MYHIFTIVRHTTTKVSQPALSIITISIFAQVAPAHTIVPLVATNLVHSSFAQILTTYSILVPRTHKRKYVLVDDCDLLLFSFDIRSSSRPILSYS